MVKTNIQTFSGEVEILSNLHLGPSGSSYLTANGAASNVLDITGNVGATFFIGDGGFLSNIATTLNDITNQGNVISNVVTFEANTNYGGVGLVTSSNVGIQNTNPLHTLSVGDKVIFDDNTVESSGQSVIRVDGRINATRFEGDGGLLSNIATTLSSIVNQGNVASNCIILEANAHYNGVGLVTSSNVGIQNANPTFDLSVGSNLHVDDTGSNVLTVHGNVVASNLNLGVFSITPAYGLNDVCNTSNGTSNVVQFQNSNTSIVTTSNINVGGQVIITGATKGLDVTSNIELGGRLKFDSNVFIDTLRVADVAANLVTYDRVTGELTDSGGTFLNKFAIVSEQPPSDLFANATTVANHGGYTLTTSNLATNSNTYNAFDGTANAWTGGTGMYIGGSNVLIETNLTQLSNLHPTQFGDWLAIEFPYKTTLRHMKLTPATVWQSFPYAANLYATNNDLTWTEIGYWDGVNPGSASNVQTITVNATEQFKKYALVTTKLVPNTNIASAVSLQDWQLFTESFSIDGGKVAMAQQAATGGETVMDQHGPHGRGEVKLKKYPEIAFAEGKFDSNETTNTYVQAGYTVTASTQYNPSYAVHNTFNDVLQDIEAGAGSILWTSATSTYPASGGFYVGTTYGIGTTYGEFIKLELPYKIKPKEVRIFPRTFQGGGAGNSQSPAQFKIFGSNDNFSSEIVELYHQNTDWVNNETWGVFDISHTNSFKHLGIVFTKTNGANIVGVQEIEYYGYEEDQPLGDTSVDTTFTSIMNTPQTTGANVYVDGNLGETFTNRVVGPTVSNTHTTYVSAEKYWELSGNVESNVTLEANTFLSGDAPHSLSMWFNSSNLVSNASNSCIFSLGTEERLDHVSAAFSNTYQTVQKLLASDGEGNDRFGQGDGVNGVSMSDDGSIAVIGAFYDDTRTGAAYIFIKDANGHWNEVQKLTASDAAQEDRFGCSTDISSDGSYIVVGSYFAHSTDGNNTADIGAAYVFKRTTGTNTWTQQQILNSSHPSSTDQFGRRVSISGDGTYIVCTEQNSDQTTANQGAAYVFKRSVETWGTPYVLEASDGVTGDYFGNSVDISSDTNYIAIGVGFDDGVGTDDDGSVYIFNRTGDNTWSQQQKINNPSVSGINNYFGGENSGVSISSDGTYLIVGAYGRASQNGAVFFFKRTVSSWSQMGSTQTHPLGITGRLFGRAVTMSKDGTTALVHARDDIGSITYAGAVYVYTRSGNTWTYKHRILHNDPTNSDHFGSGLTISSDGSYFVAGMFRDDDLGSTAGAAYIYTRDTTHHLMTDLKLQSNTWHNLTYAYQGEGGSRVTYLDGRKVLEDQAEDTFGDYPPFAMTGYSQGGYVVSESSFAGSAGTAPAWKAFDDLPLVTGSDITSPYWQSMTNTYETSGSYNWISGAGATGVQFTDTNSGQHSGEWIKLEMPHKLKLSYISYLCTYAAYMPKNFVILGSNDDNTWTLLKSVTNGPSTEDIYHDLAINADRFYKYYVVLTSAITGTGGEVLIANIKYYGHRENDLVRLPDPTNVLKYPHVAMTGPAQRGYVASASGNTGSGYPWEAFLNDPDSANGFWHGADATEYNVNDNSLANQGTAPSTIVSGSPVHGAWIQLQFPHTIIPTRIDISPRTGQENRAPKAGVLAGSDNGTDWNTIYTFSGASAYTAATYKTFTFTNTTSYKYLRLITTQVGAGGGGNGDKINIGNIEFYGTEEATSIPIQIGGGNIDKVANFRVYDKFVGEDQALEIWDAQKDEFGRAKSSMTLQKGRLGIGTTEPQGSLSVADEPHNLEEFPPRAMTGYKNYFEGHGEFCASVSSEYDSNYLGYYAFGDITHSGPTNNYNKVSWNSVDAVYSGSSPHTYTGSATLSGNSGEWIKLKCPYKVKISSYTLSFRDQWVVFAPSAWSVVGSNDDENWDIIGSESGITYPAQENVGKVVVKDFTINTVKYYKYIALVVSTLNGANDLNILELRYFGTREQGQSVLHDGQLTLTKNLTVPRIGPALDADDTPRRDRLVVEYNTSTNPTFDGAVRDTSGRGNDGVFVGTASYDASQKAFEFSGTDPAIHRIEGLGYSLKGNQQLSASFWARVDVSSQDQGFFSVGDSGGVLGKCFSFRIDVGSSNYNLEVSYSGSAHTSLYRYQVSPLATVTGGIWRHFVAINAAGTKTANGTTYDHGATSAIRLFLDGVELFTMSSSTYANGVVGSASDVLDLDPNPTLSIGSVFNGVYDMHGRISNFKLYDIALTASEVKTLYNMGRCDEGGHMVNFSKTRVGIGLGDGEAPMGDLDVRGPVVLGPGTLPEDYWFKPTLTIFETFRATASARPGGGIQFCQHDSPGQGWMMGVDTDVVSSANGCELVWEFHNNGSRTGRGAQLSAGPNITSINFTGQHRTFIKDVPFSQVGDLEGLVVSSDQNKYIKMSGGIEAGSNAITTNESLPIVSLSNVVTDKKCFGVISASENPEQRSDAYGIFKSFYPKEKGDTRVYINSVGEGAIWVSNIGGNLEAGDYITTSNIAGYGQKQESDSLKNYTVAKITMDCDFNPATQPIQQILRSNVIQTYYLGNVHKVKSVPHEFVTTTVGADDAWSNVSVKPSDVTYAEWSNLEANTQNTYNLTYTQTSNVVYDTKYTLTTTANVTESDPWDSVFVDPPSVTYAEYSNLEANTQSSYSLTFTKTTTDEKTPEEWSALESNTQSLYNMIYYQSVEEEVASDYPGATTHTRVTDVIENELDAHGQIQWEDHATETEKAYKIRYLDVSGAQTDSANAVHIAAFVGCTYHCG